MGTLITPICAPSYVRNPEGNPPSFREEDFSGFSPEPFPGAITTTAPATATVTTTTAATTATATGGTLTRVKAFPFSETFQKVSLNTSLLYYLFYGNINIFLTGESDRLYGVAAPGPLYLLYNILVQRILHFRDSGLFLIGHDKSMCNSLHELRQ